MRNLLSKIIVSSLLLPLIAFADISDDMKDKSMSLVQVLTNAMNSGMSAAEAAGKMVEADTSQSSSIVAAAVVVSPEDAEAIVASAIKAGASADTVVASALIAADGENADKIVAAAVTAAPDQRDAIVAASVRALPATSSGIAAISASPMKASVGKSSGGGASTTAAETAQLQATILEIELTLARAGFTDEEVTQAVEDITVALAESEQTANAAIVSLELLQLELENTIALQEAIPELEAAAEALEVESTAAEATVDAAIEDASSVVGAANEAALDTDVLEQQKAEVEEGVAEVEALSEITDAEELDEATEGRLVEAEAELAELPSQEQAQADLDAAVAAYDAVAEEDAQVDLDIQKTEAAIAELEANAAGRVDEVLAGAVTGADLEELRSQLAALNARKEELNAAGLQETAAQLATVVGRVETLILVVGYLDAVQTALDQGLSPLTPEFNEIVSPETSKLLDKDEQLADDIVLAVEFEIELKDDADDIVQAVEQEIAGLTELVGDLNDAETTLEDAEAAADLQDVVDAIDQVTDSLSDLNS